MHTVIIALAVAVVVIPAPAQDPIAGASTDFGLALFKKLGARKGNLIISPYSICTGLSMARTGARGETRRQLDGALHLGSEADPAGHRNLSEALKAKEVWKEFDEPPPWRKVPVYELHLANALWVQSGLKLDPAFERCLKNEFNAPVERVDFCQQSRAHARINQWVEQKTRERIKNIVPAGRQRSDTSDPVIILTNAIYFKAQWATAFMKQKTKEGVFFSSPDRKVPASFMHRIDRFSYAEDDDVQVLEISYRGFDISMVVVLPRKKDGLPGLETRLDGRLVRQWINELSVQPVSVKIPRFQSEVSFELEPQLVAMGIRNAFSDKEADFNGITRAGSLYLGDVFHKAWITVDEKGTEAAAAHVTGVASTCLPPSRGTPFVADHPFLYLIRHGKTGTVLFIGRVVDPTK